MPTGDPTICSRDAERPSGTVPLQTRPSFETFPPPVRCSLPPCNVVASLPCRGPLQVSRLTRTQQREAASAARVWQMEREQLMRRVNEAEAEVAALRKEKAEAKPQVGRRFRLTGPA